MSFAVGSLVKARGREWVVLPESSDDLLMLRPLAGMDDEVTGIYVPLEPVEPASFAPPDPTRVGDHRSCRLLRDAVRLSTRAGAGPFRSFARIAVEPRPYQLVPLLMALKLEPVRLLIADDVGVGKTIEACLVARELLDRGEVNRLAVLCPPHLAEQWQEELRDKFHIEAELVLPGTAARLENAYQDRTKSLFEVYPHLVVSTDFIKSDRRRDEFVRTAPRLVIVDEAHTCAFARDRRSGRHLRHQLLEKLSSSPDRHLILVTATPHSGKEEAFRSLLGLLDPGFADLPEDLTGPDRAPDRRRLAAHFVQRRRADIRHFLKTDTPFPEREEKEATYQLSPEYKRLFERILAYARERVLDREGGRHHQRVRWWSALALLRSVASSPAAAAATLRNRAAVADTETAEEADEVGRRAVLDIDLDELSEVMDGTPGGDCEGEDDEAHRNRRRLLEMAREADRLMGARDLKLVGAADHVKALLRGGYCPILFCRFIPTAEYLAEELRKRLPRDVEIKAVTGALPPADREERVLELGKASKRVLVCTDCLSEGINLQQYFDAVMHYDLAWAPTRHEQREGRVDRFGQARPVTRVLTYYGTDNMIDGIVLNVLIRKHKKIRSSLGISVPVPTDTTSVVEAIMEGLLMRQENAASEAAAQAWIPGFEEFFKPKREALYAEWENALEREKRSRTMFAQESIKVDEVARELEMARAGSGTAADVGAFVIEAVRAHHGVVREHAGIYRFDLSEAPRALRDVMQSPESFEGRFELPVRSQTVYLSRTHPYVESLASYVMDAALDEGQNGVAHRAGAIRTRAVSRRTTVLLLRVRHDIITCRGSEERAQLAEECLVRAFAGAPEKAEWLDDASAEALLHASPDANLLPEHARAAVGRVVEAYQALAPALEDYARARARILLDAHRRVRSATRLRGVTYKVEAKVPPDLIGVFVLLPAGT